MSQFKMASKKQVTLDNSSYSWKETNLMEFLDEGNIPSRWDEFFKKPEVLEELRKISDNLEKASKEKTIYPPINQVFRALYKVGPDAKCVIVGQDCYHNGSAVGLCFSVRPGNALNPSMLSIYKELKMEGFEPVEDGDLTRWADQGVLLLNMALTVEKGDPGSHSLLWYNFSEMLVKYISSCGDGDFPHWLLFGKDAHAIKDIADRGQFHMTSHPVPMAAHRKCGEAPAFWGSGVFKKVPGVKW